MPTTWNSNACSSDTVPSQRRGQIVNPRTLLPLILGTAAILSSVAWQSPLSGSEQDDSAPPVLVKLDAWADLGNRTRPLDHRPGRPGKGQVEYGPTPDQGSECGGPQRTAWNNQQSRRRHRLG